MGNEADCDNQVKIEMRLNQPVVFENRFRYS